MAYSNDDLRRIWAKGKAVPGYDSSKYRKDDCDAWMSWDKYGNRNSDFGWEVDHINPDGSDTISNLRPLQWENNANKQDGRLECPVTSRGNDNVHRRV